MVARTLRPMSGKHGLMAGTSVTTFAPDVTTSWP